MRPSRTRSIEWIEVFPKFIHTHTMPSCWLFSDLGLRRCRAGSFVGSLNGWMAITVDWLKGCNGGNGWLQMVGSHF